MNIEALSAVYAPFVPGDSDLGKYASPIEQGLAVYLVFKALDDGYLVSVNDGTEWTVKASRSADEVLRALATTDADFLRLRRERDDGAGTELVTTITLIWGNGRDLISDYTLPNGGEEVERFIEVHGLSGLD